MVNSKRVSIVILTYNSDQTLDQCLRAIRDLDYPEYLVEVLLLDNGSSDKTISIIEGFGFNYNSLPDFNLSELRNYGAKISSGDILAYIDSDCVVYPDWCNQVVKWFEDSSVGIAGNEYLLPADATIFERNWYNKSNYGVKYNDLIPAGNMAINKKYFHQLGGFDSNLVTGEDDYILELFRKAGYKTISDHKICSVHLGNAKNLKEYFRKESWYGLGMLGTLHMSRLDKPLIATVVFGSTLLLLCISLVLYFVTGIKNSLIILCGSFIVCMAIPLMSSIDRVYRKKRGGNIFFVMIIFAVFFLARMNSLLYISGVRKKM